MMMKFTPPAKSVNLSIWNIAAMRKNVICMATVTIALIAKWSSSNTFTAIIISCSTRTQYCAVMIFFLYYFVALAFTPSDAHSIYLSNILFFMWFFPLPPPFEPSQMDDKNTVVFSNACNEATKSIVWIFLIIFHVFYYRTRNMTRNRFNRMSISQNTHSHCQHQFNRHQIANENQVKWKFSRMKKVNFLLFFCFRCQFVAGCQWILSNEMSLEILFTPSTVQSESRFSFRFSTQRHLHREQCKQ